jgi:hypothetical protein
MLRRRVDPPDTNLTLLANLFGCAARSARGAKPRLRRVLSAVPSRSPSCGVRCRLLGACGKPQFGLKLCAPERQPRGALLRLWLRRGESGAVAQNWPASGSAGAPAPAARPHNGLRVRAREAAARRAAPATGQERPERRSGAEGGARAGRPAPSPASELAAACQCSARRLRRGAPSRLARAAREPDRRRAR